MSSQSKNAYIASIKEFREQKQIELNKAKEQVRILMAEINTIDQTLDLAEGTKPQTSPKRGKSAKIVAIDILEVRGIEGASVNDIVAISKEQGNPVERGTVSSLLSRLKKDNSVVYNDGKYYLPRYYTTHEPIYDIPSTRNDTIPNFSEDNVSDLL